MLSYGRMLKRKSIIPHNRSVYREVIPQALKISWRNPRLWIFGLFAAVLNTGGSLDTIWKFWDSIRTQGSALSIGDLTVNIWNTASIGGFSALPFLQALLALVVLSVILLAVGAFSCVSQGVIIYSIGNLKDGKLNHLKKGLTVAARALIPVAILNVLILVSVWLVRFLISLPLAIALDQESYLFMAVYLVSFIVFFVVAMILSIMQIYALNAIFLQGATLAQAFKRAWLVLKDHWLETLETALIQAALMMVLAIAAFIAILILSFPSGVLYVLAIMQNSLPLFYISFGIFVGLIIVSLTVLTGFLVTFQYALWTLMFRKFGEGGIIPKIHRLIRSFAKKINVLRS